MRLSGDPLQDLYDSTPDLSRLNICQSVARFREQEARFLLVPDDGCSREALLDASLCYYKLASIACHLAIKDESFCGLSGVYQEKAKVCKCCAYASVVQTA
jgi:hypothetical protein